MKPGNTSRPRASISTSTEPFGPPPMLSIRPSSHTTSPAVCPRLLTRVALAIRSRMADARDGSFTTSVLDVLIRGGLIIDGSGNVGFRGAVGIEGETLRVLRGDVS